HFLLVLRTPIVTLLPYTTLFRSVVVVGHQAEQVAAVVAPRGALTVLQRPQNGTGHAVQVAKRTLGRAKFAVVLPGDAPLVRPETDRKSTRLNSSNQIISYNVVCL